MSPNPTSVSQRLASPTFSVGVIVHLIFNQTRKLLIITASTVATGPNCPLANGTFIPCLERIISHVYDLIIKAQKQGIKSISPKAEAVDDFQEYKDSLMKDLVWTSDCRSWYKNGKVDGKVWGPWPGSALHFLEAMEAPRWEDWDLKYTTSNRFSYFGHGKTQREIKGMNLGYYVTQPGA